MSDETIAPLVQNSDSLMARTQRLGDKLAQLQEIRLPYPRQLVVMSGFDEIRLAGLKMKGKRMLGMTLFEPTHCGKTTAAEQYMELRNSQAPEGRLPIVYVSLENIGTSRSLYVSILQALDDGFATSGTEQILRMRAIAALEKVGAELLIVDECSHAGKKSGFGGELTSSIKQFLDRGVVPVAMLGTDAAISIFRKDRELSGRMVAPHHLGPLQWYNETDRELWIGFLKALDARMVADGIIAKPIGLSEPGLDQALCEATAGVIGHLVGTVRMALRSAVLDGRETIAFDDLVHAVDAFNIGLDLAGFNPLRDISRG
jgi:hypothetical protein